ncbi:spore germination protein [Paenibacillus sp. yr247]|uniref:spore germination protein n=1 Tax=Paenibacillus sp. yr247 TaxID=1761880 RepID=UPI000B841F74|nr:spore germination protein [Paenibacillus sp. yr247]
MKNKIKTNTNLTNENPSQNISNNIIENEKALKDIFQNCPDIIFRDITIHGQTKALLIYLDGMVNTDIITSNILKPLIYDGLPQGLGMIDSLAQMCKQELVSVLSTNKLSNFEEIVDQILKGNVAILADGENTALLADVTKFETRAIEEPFNEATIRGSKEGFTESLRMNTTMLRRILATPKMKFESLKIGRLTKTDVVIAYIEGIVSIPVLNEVRKRIHRIQIDGILESGYIEESIEETHLSPFPQMIVTERPDIVAAGLLHGKVAVLTNGGACVLVVPMTFWEGFQAPDDYYERFLFVTQIRWIRHIFALFSVVFPSVYIALTNFHPEMVPQKLMLTIATLREKAPFPTVIEVFMMELMFEGLREAGIRLPKQIGPLVSIVGALVIGEAAVRAGIISAPIVIVVSAAGISSFIIPRYRFAYALRMLRFPLLILSGVFGLFGLAIGIFAILIHLIQLSSFGTPYLTPVAPQIARRLTDVLMRWPRKRSVYNEPQNEAD